MTATEYDEMTNSARLGSRFSSGQIYIEGVSTGGVHPQPVNVRVCVVCVVCGRNGDVMCCESICCVLGGVQISQKFEQNVSVGAAGGAFYLPGVSFGALGACFGSLNFKYQL